MSDRPQFRWMAWVLAAECVWLLVPWQARQYGRFDFEVNENLVIWMGAPLAYLAARAAWKRSLGLYAVTVLAMWLWLPAALLLNCDPHGFGPRNSVLSGLILWVPLLNSLLGVVMQVQKRVSQASSPATAATEVASAASRQ